MRFAVTDTVEEVVREIGKRIAALRLSMNWSQQELSARAGVSKRSIERLEQGTENPNLKVFVAVCSALRRTPGFESLLPAIELTPQQIFAHEKPRLRARRSLSKKPKWGIEE